MSRKSLDGTRMHVIIPRPQRKSLLAMCKLTGITAAEHIRRALDLYLGEKKPPEQGAKDRGE